MGDFIGGPGPAAPFELVTETDAAADALINDFGLAPGDTAYLGKRAYTVVDSDRGQYLLVENMGSRKTDFDTIPTLFETGALGAARPSIGPGGITNGDDGSRETFSRDLVEIRSALGERREAEVATPETPFSSALCVATDALAANLIEMLQLGMDSVKVDGTVYDIGSVRERGGGTRYLRAYPARGVRSGVLLSSGIGTAGTLENEPQRERFLTDYADLRGDFQRQVARHHLNDPPGARAPLTRSLPGQ